MQMFCLLITIVLVSIGVGQTPFAQGGVLTSTPIDFPGATSTVALDINAAGQIVGRYEDAAGKTHGFLMSAGNFTSIDYPNAVSTVAAGINPSGDIVGQYRLAHEDPATIRHGFLLQGGTFTTIDFPNATFTNILGINPGGDMVGRYCLDSTSCMPGAGNAHGFLRRMNGRFEPIDVPGAAETHAWKINASEQIVGSYKDTGGTFHVYLRSKGSITPIDFPNAVATGSASGGINPQGDIVSGYCPAVPCTGQSPNMHGFLRRMQGGNMQGRFTPIDVRGAVRTIAFGINAHGDIVGLYDDPNNRTHGFLLNQ
jgi:probable HAF family extracellular repeat protein